MQDPPSSGSAFYRLNPGDWSQIEDSVRSEVMTLQTMLATATAPGNGPRPTPLDLAMKLQEVATRLFDQLGRDERDLRQIISTLRTAHAVAWDMNDAVQASQTTVEQYMSRLRQTIDAFENDLRELQHTRGIA